MSEKILFRPHHFLCTMNFKGKGYSPSFVRNYQKILNELQANPKQQITIVNTIDSICSACPKRQENRCENQKNSISFDKRHEQAFGFTPGKKITWEAALLQVQQQLSPSVFNSICEGCPWKKELCDKNLHNLTKNKNHPPDF